MIQFVSNLIFHFIDTLNKLWLIEAYRTNTMLRKAMFLLSFFYPNVSFISFVSVRFFRVDSVRSNEGFTHKFYWRTYVDKFIDSLILRVTNAVWQIIWMYIHQRNVNLKLRKAPNHTSMDIKTTFIVYRWNKFHQTDAKKHYCGVRDTLGNAFKTYKVNKIRLDLRVFMKCSNICLAYQNRNWFESIGFYSIEFDFICFDLIWLNWIGIDWIGIDFIGLEFESTGIDLIWINFIWLNWIGIDLIWLNWNLFEINWILFNWI